MENSTEKLLKEKMNFNGEKLVCSNCEASDRVIFQSSYICYKMADKENLVQPYGTCDHHSEKTFQNLLQKTESDFYEIIWMRW